MITYNETVKEVYTAILEAVKYELEDLLEDSNSKQSDLYDIMHEELDNIVSCNSRDENLKAIDDTGNENQIDEGMINRNADLSMQLAQMAYCCVETELFNDPFFQKLQQAYSNVLDKEEAQELLDELNDHLE